MRGTRALVTLIAIVSTVIGGASTLTACTPKIQQEQPKMAEFPHDFGANLTPTQLMIISLTEREYKEQPPGTKYSEGISEAWCVDFISWTFREAGIPLENPNTGGWRIPGTVTLRDYYQANGRFHPAKEGYQPSAGDVAIYQGSPIFGDHANIVLTNVNGVLTTVGGNEAGRIRVYENAEQNYTGLIGFGSLQ